MKSFFSKKIVVGALVTAIVCVSGITDAKAQEFTVRKSKLKAIAENTGFQKAIR